MNTMRSTLRWLVVATLAGGCASGGVDDPLGPDDAPVFAPDGTKADGFALRTDDYEGQAILRVANELSEAQLDDVVPLDRRAAANIVARRDAQGPFTTLMDVDDVSYVGQRAFDLMLAYAEGQGWIGACGDGVVQGNEDCDGAEGCPRTCVNPPNDGDGGPDGTFVHGIENGGYAALGILAAANTLAFETLDVDAALDVRAARSIVADRPFSDLAGLDTAGYVGAGAFELLLTYADGAGITPACGDGRLQPGLETCDDGNGRDGDGCSAACAIEPGHGEDGALDTPRVNGVHEGSYAALGILAVANTTDFDTLDVAIALDVRAARGIVSARGSNGFSDLAALDAVPFVGDAAFTHLLTWAHDHALVPRCGDGIVQPVQEGCDGTPGCDATCQPAYTCGDGVPEAGEACDDGNLEGDDGCSALCRAEWLDEGPDGANGSLAEAVELGAYELASGHMQGEGDRDYWAFTLDRPSRVTVDVWSGAGEACAWFSFGNPAGGFDSDIFEPELSLRDADDRVVRRFSALCGRREPASPDLDIELPPGTWYIRFEGQDVGSGWDAPYSVDYRLAMKRIGRGPVCGDGTLDAGEACDDGNADSDDGCSQACLLESFVELEPNDTAATAHDVGGFRRLEGTLAGADRDAWAVDLDDGAALSATVTASFDGLLAIYGPDGDLLAEKQDGGKGGAPGFDADADGLTDLLAGRYVLILRAADPAAAGGTYRLDLRVD